MEVPGSIPAVRKSHSLVMSGRHFFDFFTCWSLLGDTFERGWGHFWSGRGHFFVIFGMSWEVSGSGLGMFLDRFWKVLKKCPTGSET